MTLITFIQVVLVCLLGAMSPGPSMLVVINNALFKNRFHGFLTSIGHGTGILIYAFLTILGLGYLIDHYPLIFDLFQYLSAFILVYLGIKNFFFPSKIEMVKNTIKNKNISILQGFGISFFNPKIFIWFIAIYSQFMSANNELIFNIYLVSIAGIIDACWYIILTLAVTTASALHFFQTKMMLIQKIQGFFFMALGLGLLINLLV